MVEGIKTNISFMDKIKQIEEALLKAEARQSNLSQQSKEIGGMTSPKIRHMMNNLGAISTEYFEIGVHRGALFFATIDGNRLGSAVACDNFSQFNTDGAEGEFRGRMKDHIYSRKPPLEVHLIDIDCFEVEALERRPDLYLYDGNHGREETKRGITHFAPMMADYFILCVDDFDWTDVSDGAKDGIEESGIEIVRSWTLKGEDGYHNGFFVALCKNN